MVSNLGEVIGLDFESSAKMSDFFFSVPLEPLSPRIRNVTSRWIELTWQPPSNGDSLGSDLLGYRVYVEELCDHHHHTTTSHQIGHEATPNKLPLRPENCREISPETVHGASSLMASFDNLGNNIFIIHENKNSQERGAAKKISNAKD